MAQLGPPPQLGLLDKHQKMIFPTSPCHPIVAPFQQRGDPMPSSTPQSLYLLLPPALATLKGDHRRSALSRPTPELQPSTVGPIYELIVH